jgi:transcriptional regulator with XRE-family HTH domain
VDELTQGLVARRKALGLTQEQVAGKIGVEQSAVAEFESGRSDPLMSTLRRYARAVGAKVGHELVPDPSERQATEEESAMFDTLLAHQRIPMPDEADGWRCSGLGCNSLRGTQDRHDSFGHAWHLVQVLTGDGWVSPDRFAREMEKARDYVSVFSGSAGAQERRADEAERLGAENLQKLKQYQAHFEKLDEALRAVGDCLFGLQDVPVDVRAEYARDQVDRVMGPEWAGREDWYGDDD